MLVAGLLIGCTPAETQAFRTLTGSKAIIESEMAKHGECKNSSTTPLCNALNRAIPAQHAAVLALDAYCASTDYLTNQGPCKPPTDPTAKAELKAKLQTAVGNLNGIVASVKAAAGGAK